MLNKNNLIYQALRPGIKSGLKNVFKLSGWTLWLALFLIDTLWHSVIETFIDKEIAKKNGKKRKEASSVFRKDIREKVEDGTSLRVAFNNALSLRQSGSKS